MTTDLQTLRALNARFIHNFITNDARGHAEIIHPRFICISSSGSKTGRAQYLKEWQTGFDSDVTPYWDTRDERIDVFGDGRIVSVYIQGVKQA
jgi:Domain of unknown function (DUF4440)